MRRLFILLVLGSWLSTATAQLLYQVSGNSAQAKSYILATNKFVDMTFIDTIPNTFKCFGRCDKVITEFAFQDYEALAVLRQAALLPDSIRLRNFYNDKQYDYIDESLQLTLGMGLDKLARMKPSYLTEMYRTELFKKWLHYDETRSMEGFFQAVAAERSDSENTSKMPVYGLDKIGETMYMLFDREPFHYQCEELYNLIENPELDVKQEATIRDMYLMGRLTDIAYQVEGPDNRSTISYSDYQVYAKRNIEWVKRLQPYLHEGKAFIVLDCIYLGGDKGLLAQLRKAGYKVKPVNKK